MKENISKENYLKTIYTLSKGNGGNVSTSEIAQELKVTKSAITDMVNRLSKQGYINYQKYKGVKILSKGKKEAKNILRKHRLWEVFLIKTLNYKWEDVHEEAERLEHCTTNSLINKIDEYLKFPKFDPHGAPIPNDEGNYRTTENSFPLSECSIGKIYTVARVIDKNIDLIRYLSQINLLIDKKIKIIDKLSFDNSIIVEIDKMKHSLSEILVKQIFIKAVKE